ncbi:MAG: ParA family protein [Comamonadaceae bacterium]|nr:ParA family protein [Comamonadaceae bacterium]
MVDLDPQGNSTQLPARRPAADDLQPGAGRLLRPDAALQRCVPTTTRDFVVADAVGQPATCWPRAPALDELHGKLESRYKIYKLRDALAELADDYDAICIDTPPALNFYTRSALIAADACLIPFDCDDFSRRALYGAAGERAGDPAPTTTPTCAVEGIVVNQFQARASLPQQHRCRNSSTRACRCCEPYLSASGEDPRVARAGAADDPPRPEPQADAAARRALRGHRAGEEARGQARLSASAPGRPLRTR